MERKYSILVIICFLFSFGNGEILVSLGTVNVNEWFSIKIEPKMFNLTTEHPNQFEYRFSLKNYPDLPSWLRFMYSTEYNSGFLYGTPPETLGGYDVNNNKDFLIICFLFYMFDELESNICYNLIEIYFDM